MEPRLAERIRRLTGWADSTPRVLYGRYIPNPRVIVFDLTTAQLAQLQPMPTSPPQGGKGSRRNAPGNPY